MTDDDFLVFFPGVGEGRVDEFIKEGFRGAVLDIEGRRPHDELVPWICKQVCIYYFLACADEAAVSTAVCRSFSQLIYNWIPLSLGLKQG